ncbi:NAD-dependent epimerase/dehydratase family protein [Naasia aerilata]|uniref:NAD-dependent epimerase/dehydratase n=1 Tax=Naasia aerilata TaxID=1162966 RepID=A0ABM8G8M7_9MICO|nr:NAD-dependent epimerase/dehydratase family protein [Naasia aerilata]BDZ44545.1 NAD-dependent epimerase/dehydratase [Naasia aerilata]
MRVVIIGATGHVGTYLVPRLVADGHEVVAVSRGRSAPYREHEAWTEVERLIADREAEDADGVFAGRIAALAPDAVVDMVCFTVDSARQLADALRGSGAHLVHTGTIWTHGTLTEVPAKEDAPKRPWGEYGMGKEAIERLLLAEADRPDGVRVSIVHPGHISGPGWPIVTPQGTTDVGVWRALATGGELLLPGFGLETVHHVHAADVAQLIRLCLEQPERAEGEAFHAVSESALTLRGFAEAAAGWFGQEARLRFVPFDDFQASLAPEFRDAAYQHVARSHSMSIEKARQRLGYAPDSTSLGAVAEAVEWLRQDGRLGPGIPPVRIAAPR